MTRDEIVWLAVRILGLCVAYTAITSGIAVVATGVGWLQAVSIASSDLPEIAAQGELDSARYLVSLPPLALAFVLKSALAVYLLRGGKAIFSLMNPPPTNDSGTAA